MRILKFWQVYKKYIKNMQAIIFFVSKRFIIEIRYTDKNNFGMFKRFYRENWIELEYQLGVKYARISDFLYSLEDF